MALPEERKAITYCPLTTLRSRGWTPFLVRAFLGEPDRTVPVELYLTSRVEEAESRSAFVEARDLRQRRAEALRQSQERRRRRAMEALRTASLRLPELSAEELASRAVRHRNVRDAQRAALSWGHRPRPATAESAFPADLARWQVDYLRDLLGRHRSLLEDLPTEADRAEGRRLLSERVHAAIATAYPHLELECRRQQAAARTA